MKKLFESFIILFFFACSQDNCGEIIDKVVEANKKLVIRFDEGGGTNQGDYNGEVVADIEVSNEIFSNFSEGETYCVE